MKFKKLAAASLAAIMTVSALSGCNSSSDNNTTSETADTATESATATDEATDDVVETENSEEKVTLNWVLWDETTTPYYGLLKEAYEEAHPNVTIETTDLGATDYMTMLSTQLAGGADFDVLTIKDVPGYANLVKQNFLEPLDSYIDAAGISSDDYSGLFEQLEVDGSLYEIPYISSFWVLFYNKDLFDAAGVEYPNNDMTMEDYDELMRLMTSGSGNDKVYGGHYHTWRSTVQLFGVLDGRNSIVDGSYDFLKQYYQMVIDLQDDGIIMDYSTLTTSSTHYSGVFYNEQAAMVNMGTWFISSLIAAIENGESSATNWGIVKYPHPKDVEEGTTLAQITSLAVNANSTKKDAAFDFIQFVTGEEGAEILASTGNFPALSSDSALDIIASLENFPDDEASREALNVTKSYLEMPLHDKSSEIETILNEEHASIMAETISVEEGIENMNTRVQELLAE